MMQSLIKSFGIGVVAGMRSMMAPALLSRKLGRTLPTQQPGTLPQYLAQPTTTGVLTVLAGGEVIGDKLPNAPNRTSPPAFIARIASGSTCGAVISEVEDQPAPYGAVAGGLGAVVGTLLFFNLRRWLDHDLGLPDTVGAVAEDALAIGGGWRLVNTLQPASKPA